MNFQRYLSSIYLMEEFTKFCTLYLKQWHKMNFQRYLSSIRLMSNLQSFVHFIYNKGNCFQEQYNRSGLPYNLLPVEGVYYIWVV